MDGWMDEGEGGGISRCVTRPPDADPCFRSDTAGSAAAFRALQMSESMDHLACHSLEIRREISVN